MLRNILAGVMALLLLGVQHKVQWHELEHLAEWRQAMQDPDSDALCVECLLLAATANAAPAGHPPPLDQTLGDFVLVDARAAIRPAGVPAYYSSRAPPAQL